MGLNKIWNNSSALVCHDSTVADIMKALDSYDGTFDLKYRVIFVDVGTKDIVHSTLYSEYLPVRTRATFVRYIRIAKQRINESALLTMLERFSTKGWMGKNLEILHFDCSVPCSSQPCEVIYIYG